MNPIIGLWYGLFFGALVLAPIVALIVAQRRSKRERKAREKSEIDTLVRSWKPMDRGYPRYSPPAPKASAGLSPSLSALAARGWSLPIAPMPSPKPFEPAKETEYRTEVRGSFVDDSPSVSLGDTADAIALSMSLIDSLSSSGSSGSDTFSGGGGESGGGGASGEW